MSLPSTLRRVGRLFWRRPKTTAVAFLVLLVPAAGGGAHLWAMSEERATRRALREEHYAEARRHVDHCLLVWPRSAPTHLLAARVARLQTDYAAAEAHLHESTRLAGGATAATQLEWLLLRVQAGEVDEVAPGLLRLVNEGDPESAAVLEALSGAYVREMRLHPALSCLNAWLRRDPDSVPALDRRGWVLERLQARDQARADWERAVELAPERWETRMRLVELLLDDADPGDALPHVERLRRSRPDRPEVLAALGRCRFLEGDLAGAEEALDRVLAASPGDVKGLVGRAKIALQRGQDAEAEGWLRRALETDPYYLDAHSALCQSLEHQAGRGADAAAQRSQYEALKADAERLSKLMKGDGAGSPQDADRCAEVGVILMRVGRETLALQWLHRALRQDEKCPAAHEALAAYYERKGDADKAQQHRARLVAEQQP
jgi:tetratricopeptide (TPR) repeat protein